MASLQLEPSLVAGSFARAHQGRASFVGIDVRIYLYVYNGSWVGALAPALGCSWRGSNGRSPSQEGSLRGGSSPKSCSLVAPPPGGAPREEVKNRTRSGCRESRRAGGFGEARRHPKSSGGETRSEKIGFGTQSWTGDRKRTDPGSLRTPKTVVSCWRGCQNHIFNVIRFVSVLGSILVVVSEAKVAHIR